MKSSRGGGAHKDYINRARAPMRKLSGDHRRFDMGSKAKLDEESLQVERELEHNTFMHQLVRLHINTDFGPSP